MIKRKGYRFKNFNIEFDEIAGFVAYTGYGPHSIKTVKKLEIFCYFLDKLIGHE